MVSLVHNPEHSVSASRKPGLDMDLVRELGTNDVALIIDDDMDAVQLLKITLQREGINVVGALSGDEALNKCVDIDPDIVLLDIMMPGMDGWETLGYLRKITDVPIVIISAILLDDAVVKALSQGAEDYIRKPFSSKEVVARVKAVLRRNQAAKKKNVLVFPEVKLTINLDTHQVSLGSDTVKLTPSEFSVLAYLAQHPREPISYQSIAKEVWGEVSPKIQKRLKWVIHQLRRKLEGSPSNVPLIINLAKFGYQFTE